jgi:beta-xylosidase
LHPHVLDARRPRHLGGAVIMRRRTATFLAVAAAFLSLAATAQAYTNPVHPSTFPDPMVVKDGGTYWAYATGVNFRVASSPDLVTWTDRGTALRSRPSWAVNESEWHPWAPAVVRREAKCPKSRTPGCFLMFYSALSDDFGRRTNCMAVATSPTPGGPFTDRGILRNGQNVKVGCGDANGFGNIDAHPFVDTDGQAYLYTSTDYACADGACQLRPTLSVMRLSRDLMTVTSPRQPLFTGALSWEARGDGHVVEGPFVVKRAGTYHLLYSGGAWTANYGMGHTTASSPTGPFVRSADQPFLTSTATVLDPGGGSLVTGPRGDTWLAYHARDERLPQDNRKLYIDRLTWPDERPVLEGPTTTPVEIVP